MRIPRDALPEHGMGDAGIRTDQDDDSRILRGLDRCTAGRRTRTPACRRRPPRPCTGGCCRRRGPFPCRTWRRPRATPFPRWRSGRCSGRQPNRRRASPGSRGTARPSSPSPRPNRPAAAGRRRRGTAGRSARSGASRTVKRLPALGAGHPAVHRVVGRRTQVDRLAVAEMHRQAATRRAEAADHPRGRIRRLAGGDLAQPEPARLRTSSRVSRPSFAWTSDRRRWSSVWRLRVSVMTAALPASSVA